MKYEIRLTNLTDLSHQLAGARGTTTMRINSNDRYETRVSVYMLTEEQFNAIGRENGLVHYGKLVYISRVN